MQAGVAALNTIETCLELSQNFNSGRIALAEGANKARSEA